jgi:hypothetical protein
VVDIAIATILGLTGALTPPLPPEVVAMLLAAAVVLAFFLDAWKRTVLRLLQLDHRVMSSIDPASTPLRA